MTMSVRQLIGSELDTLERHRRPDTERLNALFDAATVQGLIEAANISLQRDLDLELVGHILDSILWQHLKHCSAPRASNTELKALRLMRKRLAGYLEVAKTVDGFALGLGELSSPELEDLVDDLDEFLDGRAAGRQREERTHWVVAHLAAVYALLSFKRPTGTATDLSRPDGNFADFLRAFKTVVEDRLKALGVTNLPEPIKHLRFGRGEGALAKLIPKALRLKEQQLREGQKCGRLWIAALRAYAAELGLQ